MRTRRILQKSIPKPTNPLREASFAATLTPHRQLTSYRTTLLCKASWEDTHWNFDQRHVTLRKFVFVALYGDHVTYNVASARGGLILALRLSAVPTQPALRLQQIPRPAWRRCNVIQRVPWNLRSAKRGLFPSQQGQRESRSMPNVWPSLSFLSPEINRSPGNIRAINDIYRTKECTSSKINDDRQFVATGLVLAWYEVAKPRDLRCVRGP